MVGYRPLVIVRHSPGMYVKGEWHEGLTTTINANGSVQPLSILEQQTLPEGKRKGSAVKVYLDTEVFCARLVNDIAVSADNITYKGKFYEVIQIMPYDDLITHNKVIAVELVVS